MLLKKFPKSISSRLTLFLLTTILFFSISSPIIVQSKTKQELSNYAFLLKNPNETKEFLKELNAEKNDVNVTVIEEIGLVYVEGNKQDKYALEFLPTSVKLDKYIIEKGELPKLEASLNELETIPFSDDLVQRDIKSQYPELISTEFRPFNWYLEDVTTDYKAQAINTGEGTSIALIDSGVDSNHPLLKNHINLKSGKNYTSDMPSVEDEMGHGTSIAGILTSIAPDSKITPYKVLGAKDGESIWSLKAIVDAVNNGNDVINMSLGTYKSKSNKEDRVLIKAYEMAVKYAKKEGTLVVSSAGNYVGDLDELKKQGKLHLPGSTTHSISVTSNTKSNTLSSYSNFGKHIDFSAPGGDLDESFDVSNLVLTTYPHDRPNTIIDEIVGIPTGYTLSMGTSLSAPQVSATTALIISEYRKLNGKDPNRNKVIKYLKQGAEDIGTPGYDRFFGYGKVNAYRSLISIQK